MTMARFFALVWFVNAQPVGRRFKRWGGALIRAASSSSVEPTDFAVSTSGATNRRQRCFGVATWLRRFHDQKMYSYLLYIPAKSASDGRCVERRPADDGDAASSVLCRRGDSRVDTERCFHKPVQLLCDRTDLPRWFCPSQPTAESY